MSEIVAKAVELRGQGLSYSTIAATLSEQYGVDISKDRVQKLVARHGPPAVSETRKVVVAGDVHAAPDPDLIELIISEDPDIVVWGGDLTNSSSLSTHERNQAEPEELFKSEVSIIRGMITQISERTSAEQKILHGNHDVRLYRALQRLVPEDVLDLIGDPLSLACKGIDRVEITSMSLEARSPDGKQSWPIVETQFMYQVGDVIVSHNNFCGKNPGAASQKLYRWVRDHERYLGLSPVPSVYIQLHGHKVSLNELEGGHAVLIEPGMAGLPKVESYKYIYKTVYLPGSIGAVALSQTKRDREWLTDKASIRLLRPHR